MRHAAALINPNLLVQRNDPLTTGIVYMPIALAYLAAQLREDGVDPIVIDAFARAPRRARPQGKFMVHGLTPDEVVDAIPADASVAFVFANQLLNHDSVAAILGRLRARRPDLLRVVLENTQAVTAYALGAVKELLFESGAQLLLVGEAERRGKPIVELVAAGASVADLLAQIPGLHAPEGSSHAAGFDQALDELPVPAWDLFPLEAYWGLNFGHGPVSSSRYLPLLTSRGCPYPCKFCVVPATNQRTWRQRSARNVVDEIESLQTRLGVSEFHIEDLNPTISDKRIREICAEIQARGLEVTWKIAAGTKVESIKNEETLDLMYAAGCRYISISPESGSSEVMKAIDKPFKLGHAINLVRHMNATGIRSQACFVLGFPGETREQRQLSYEMAKTLTEEGLDEIAVFIISPVPGSEIFETFTGYESLSELSFTPTWREDYEELKRFRLRLYGSFLAWKLRRHPRKILRQAKNFATGNFETKMEMVPFRALYWKACEARGRLLARLGSD